LELHDGLGNTLVANDDWKDDQQADIEATGLEPSDDRESAILSTLVPGAYTAIVRGALDTTVVGLVEVYHLQYRPTTRVRCPRVPSCVKTGQAVIGSAHQPVARYASRMTIYVVRA